MKKLLFRSAATLSVTAFFSYVFGLIRDKTFAYIYGTSRTLDAYHASFIIPDLLLNLLVAGALTSAFLPIYTSLRTKDSQEHAQQIFCSLVTLAVIVLTIIGMIFLLFMPDIVQFITPGFTDEELKLVARMSSILLLSPLIFAISNSAGSVLISHKQFIYYGLSPIFYNIGTVLGTIFLYKYIGIYGSVIGTICGALFHLAIRLIGLHYSKVQLFPLFDFHFPELKKIGKLMIPKMVGFGAWQFLLWSFIAIASTLKEGSIVVYNFARNFQSVPVSIFGIAIATATFPVLSKHAANKDFEKFKIHLHKGMKKILLICIPSAIGMAVMSYFIIWFFLGGGKFDAEAISLTALTLSIYCIAVPSESMMHLLARAFYAELDTLTPTIIQIGSIIIMVISAWHFSALYGVIGIPIGFSIGSWMQVLSLGVILKWKNKTQD